MAFTYGGTAEYHSTRMGYLKEKLDEIVKDLDNVKKLLNCTEHDALISQLDAFDTRIRTDITNLKDACDSSSRAVKSKAREIDNYLGLGKDIPVVEIKNDLTGNAALNGPSKVDLKRMTGEISYAYKGD